MVDCEEGGGGGIDLSEKKSPDIRSLAVGTAVKSIKTNFLIGISLSKLKKIWAGEMTFVLLFAL